MTEQYGQPNINNPRLVRNFTATASPVAIQLTYDDGLVTADTTAGVIGFILPLASQFPGWQIIIKADNAGTTGNSVFVGTVGGSGETIDGAAFVLLTTDQEALFLKSDGTNWRVVAGSTGASATNISLDITFDSTAPASVAPILFITWPEVITAVGAIPGNPGAAYQKTKYRLNVNTLASVDPGLYDLSNAEFRSAIKSSPAGGGAFLFGSGAFTIDNVAQLNGISVFGVSFGSTFTWSTFTFFESIDCSFSQTTDGVGPGVLSFPLGFTIMRCYGVNLLGAGAIEIGSAPGDKLVIDAYDRFAMLSSAAIGPGDLDINIFSGDTDISFIQPLVGTFNINIGGGQTANGELYTLGETILFSAGGPIALSAGESELYAGGTNPPGTIPQTPPLGAPFRGYTASKDGYLRGISIRIPTDGAPVGPMFVRVYVAGALVMTEGFINAGATRFSATTFAQYSEGDSIQVTIAGGPSDPPPGDLPDGIVVALRSA